MRGRCVCGFKVSVPGKLTSAEPSGKSRLMGKRHPQELGTKEVEALLSALAVQCPVPPRLKVRHWLQQKGGQRKAGLGEPAGQVSCRHSPQRGF
jgi:hypothetical protein